MCVFCSFFFQRFVPRCNSQLVEHIWTNTHSTCTSFIDGVKKKIKGNGEKVKENRKKRQSIKNGSTTSAAAAAAVVVLSATNNSAKWLYFSFIIDWYLFYLFLEILCVSLLVADGYWSWLTLNENWNIFLNHFSTNNHTHYSHCALCPLSARGTKINIDIRRRHKRYERYEHCLYTKIFYYNVRVQTNQMHNTRDIPSRRDWFSSTTTTKNSRYLTVIFATTLGYYASHTKTDEKPKTKMARPNITENTRDCEWNIPQKKILRMTEEHV